jgi:DNA-binding PucR family transcriptional regulator
VATGALSPVLDDLRPEAEAVVREAASELAPHVAVLATDMAAQLREHVPELGEGDEVLDGLYVSCESNVATVLWMLGQGVPATQSEAPVGALEFARTLVRKGNEVAALLRAYRRGQAIFSSWWTSALSDRVEDPRVLACALDRSLGFVFEYLDRVCLRVVEVYTDERERWLRSSAAVRAETVGAILADEPVELEAASARLGYELRRHQLGMVLWVEERVTSEDSFDRLEQSAVRLAAAVGCSRPLLVPAGPRLLWAWANAYEPAAFDTLAAAAEALDGVHVAIGEWSMGQEGLRRSHEEALHARRVARLVASPPAPITKYDDVVLASLFGADLARARCFVADTLGPLATDDDRTLLLRETLRAFLGEGSSHVGAARQLHCHQNTVAYRVHRAEELMDHSVTTKRLETELALALAHLLGETVLLPADGDES